MLINKNRPRKEQYLQLIEQLISFPNEEEVLEILNNNLDLVDKGLVKALFKEADRYSKYKETYTV